MAKVFVVDDEDSYCQHLAWAISAAGHEVKTARDGRSALQIGRAFCPDVLIADWMLRDQFDGIGLAAALREVNPRLTTIIISGYLASDLVNEPGASGVFAFVQKPFDLNDIRDILERACAAAGAP
jgi:DNA-binding NtrC family response regulator